MDCRTAPATPGLLKREDSVGEGGHFPLAVTSGVLLQHPEVQIQGHILHPPQRDSHYLKKILLEEKLLCIQGKQLQDIQQMLPLVPMAHNWSITDFLKVWETMGSADRDVP